jgi:hypothetical protein
MPLYIVAHNSDSHDHYTHHQSTYLELLGALTTHHYTQSHTRGYACRLGHKYLHAREEARAQYLHVEWKGEEDGRRRERRMGGGHAEDTDLQRRAHNLLSVHANCLMKCLIEMLDRMLDEMIDRILEQPNVRLEQPNPTITKIC